jgi:hypothetical protein
MAKHADAPPDRQNQRTIRPDCQNAKNANNDETQLATSRMPASRRFGIEIRLQAGRRRRSKSEIAFPRRSVAIGLQ